MIQVIGTVTESYRQSAELGLCLDLFKEALPSGTSLNLVESHSDEDTASLLRRAMLDFLRKPLPDRYLLLLREPALMVGPQAICTMVNVLERHETIGCVVPVDPRGLRGSRVPDYYTLYGFQRFVETMNRGKPEIGTYNGQEPYLYLARTKRLRTLELPPNPFDVPRLMKAETVVALKSYVHPFLDYYEEKRTDLFDRIPDGVRTVLDIGCARGAFGGALRAMRDCRVVGIEQNPSEAEKAGRLLDRVLVGDALQVKLQERFDLITCLDTLEHFTDPDRLITKIRDELLVDSGFLLLTLPNIGHWSILESLLAGRWDYLPVGILCNTHLRFFTRLSLLALLEKHGFEIISVHPASGPLPDSFRTLLEKAESNGLAVDKESLDAYGYTILARRASRIPAKGRKKCETDCIELLPL